MRSTMRTITDVNLDSRAVDLSVENTLSFTNNSDSTSVIYIEFRDMETGESRTHYWGDGVTTSWQRGQTVRLSLGSVSLEAGRDYMCVPTIYQSQPNVPEEETSPAKFDVYMGAGLTQEASSGASNIYIDRDIGFIRPPVRRDGKLVGGCVLRLPDRDLLIDSYSPDTGKAVVSSARINGRTYEVIGVKPGVSYKLITNYLVCDAFCFYPRTEPTVELSCKITARGIEATGEYSQAEGVAMRSWRMWVDYLWGNGNGETVIEHEERFSQTMQDVFPVHDTAMELHCEVTTQDGYVKRFKQRIGIGEVGGLDVLLDGSSLIINDMPEGASRFVWSYRREGNVLYDMRYLDGMSQGAGGSLSYFLGRGQEYFFDVVAVDSEGNMYGGSAKDHSGGIGHYFDDSKAWSLHHLTPLGCREYRIDPVGCDFAADVQPSAIETATGNAYYNSEGKYPKFIRGSSGYETGSFTALLGGIGGRDLTGGQLEATARTIAKWCEFITREGLFLLKTDSGDVKIVAVTGNPARQYGSSIAELGLTRVTYTWVEVEDIERAVIHL